jgi:hypothetical protein
VNIKNNPPLQTLFAWVVITILAIFGIFAPSIFGMDGFKGGFAISTLCLLLVISGVIVIIIYTGRARTLNTILKGENVLAHWKYTPEEWNEYAEKEFKEQKATNKVLFFVIAAFALFFGILFMLFDFDVGKWVMVVMLALIAIIGFTAWFTAWYNYRQNKKYLGETYITKEAIYLNRQLHTWHGLGARLDSVDLSQKKSSSLLVFAYSAPTRTGMQEYTVRIPVPRGQEKAAEKMLEYFKNSQGTD